MIRLTDAALLTLFEQGRSANALRRAHLLGTALLGEKEVNIQPISDLDRAAWSLRQSMIHGAAEATCACPACAAQLEFELPQAFKLPERSADMASIVVNGETYDIRLPALADITSNGIAVANLSANAPWEDKGFRQTAEAALEQIDPLLRFEIAMTCADCGAQTNHRFDVIAFVWTELEDRARHLITQITTLARHFGWSERDILGMSGRRRALYLAELPS